MLPATYAHFPALIPTSIVAVFQYSESEGNLCSRVTTCDSHTTMDKHKVPIYGIQQLKMLQESKVYVVLYKQK